MKRYIHVLYVMVACVILCSSCLGSNDTTDVTGYNEMAITAFKLTTVNRYVHTTGKSGNDSVYKKSLSNPVVFTINQETHEIYNTDSLPHDTDAKHILASITSYNSSDILIKSVVGDTLTYYSSTDSIDFSQPREIRVYAIDRSGYRSYNVKVNIHQVDNSQILWEQMTAEDVPASGLATGLKAFIGSGTKESYAISQDGQLMVSTDGGDTWTPDSIGDDPAMLPTDNIAFLSVPFTVNDSTDYQLMVGTTPNYPEGCVVWRKIAEYAAGSAPSKWVLIPVEDYNVYTLPWLEHLNLLSYRGLILAIGNDGKIYQSRDLGITWKVTSSYTLPEGLKSNNLSAWTVDEYIWLVGNDTGEVWRGIKIE